jgi:hypothetical protein
MRGFSWSSHPRLTRFENHRGVKRTLAAGAILLVGVLGGLYAASVTRSPDTRPVPAIELTQPERSAEKRVKDVTAARPATASHRSSGSAPKSRGSGALRVQIAPVPAGGGEANDDPDDDPDDDRGDDGSDDE